MDKSLIINEIKTHLGIKTDTDFAKFLGVTQPTISTWRSRNTLDYDLIIAKCNNINANWLLTGKGEMLKGAQQTAAEPIHTQSASPCADKEQIIALLKENKNLLNKEIQRLEQENNLLKKELSSLKPAGNMLVQKPAL